MKECGEEMQKRRKNICRLIDSEREGSERYVTHMHMNSNLSLLLLSLLYILSLTPSPFTYIVL